MNLSDEIIKGLKARFQFRKTRGAWMQEGKCPQCGKMEAYCAAEDPKVIKCNRIEKCGWEDTVRNQLPDLFEDWSKRHPTTPENPTATADAYLLHERGLDLRLLRGSYTQELFRDQKTGATSATVRFKVGETHWERIIDKPGRFEKKAHFTYGGSWKGHVWAPPATTLEVQARADEILIAEGIFDATALTQVHRVAVSAMSVNVWPDRWLAELRAECVRIGRKDFPRLVFAFDVGAAGVKWTRNFVDRAKKEGWEAEAMQVRPDGEGTKLDWNDLLLRHLDWDGEGQDPMGDEAFATYRYNGAITIAKTAREKAILMADQKVAVAAFEFRHGNRLWWAKVTFDEDSDPPKRRVQVEEIANCAFRLLYRERDEIEDETNYFLQVDFPDQPTVKARFTHGACANSSEFKKRLMAFAGMWKGSGEQLDRIMGTQMRRLKVVRPIAFTGYSREDEAWVLGDLAVRNGRIEQVNADKYFDFGKSAVKLRSAERLLDITYDPDRLKFDWLPLLWTAWGAKGVVALAFFTMSLFAVQIRKRDGSLGFLEITGEAGAGKSTLVEFLWRLFGRLEYEGFDPNKTTRAGMARELVKVSGLPVGLIEGRRDDDKRTGQAQFDYNELLVLYNGRAPRTIGAKTGGYETYSPPFQGSIYLMQNERIDGIPAVLERLMSMRIDKASWSPATKEAATKLKRWPLTDVSGTIVHVVRQEAAYLDHFFKRFEIHDAEMPKRVAGLHNARPIMCHAQLAAAVECLPGLFPAMRPEWVAQTLELVDAMALDRQESAGGDHPTVASFWEKVDYLISRESATDHGDGKSLNQHRDAESLMAISLNDFEARCRHAGISTPDMDTLRKALRGSKSRKWLATKAVNNPAGRSVKCWVFEQPKRQERVI
ncbi:bifunctional DNA primase/helicase [Novosphingobium sp. FSY-8]|uniref:Bifunctional DNA primase/helicase n=1 Tax=Novosphingobium ovatum TaxID=1908523 RepID=A0ABW9XAG6_9SPHN|nr:toprim domain-containing protein [Novosphingobium ovatum]NBC35523.1 bifunctional DNA primase/helicase [Novosphingobium ovatum]